MDAIVIYCLSRGSGPGFGDAAAASPDISKKMP